MTIHKILLWFLANYLTNFYQPKPKVILIHNNRQKFILIFTNHGCIQMNISETCIFVLHRYLRFCSSFRVYRLGTICYQPKGSSCLASQIQDSEFRNWLLDPVSRALILKICDENIRLVLLQSESIGWILFLLIILMFLLVCLVSQRY